MERKSGLGLLIVIVVVGGLVVAGERFPMVRRVTEFAFSAIEILLGLVLVGVLAASWYLRKKDPEAAVAEEARRRARPPNPYWRQLLAASAVSFVGFAALVISALHAFGDPPPETAWIALALGTLVFATSLLFALPRLHRFAQHSADELLRELAEPPDVSFPPRGRER